MQPGRQNFTGQKANSRFALPLNVCDENDVPTPLAGWSAVMKIERADVPGIALQATSASGGILLDGSPFNVILDFDLKLKAGSYTYDLVLIDPDGRHYPVLTGNFEVEASTV